MTVTMKAKRTSQQTCQGHNKCTQHEHFAMDVIEDTFNIDIDEMFTMLFTDSQFIRAFIKRRRTYDVKLTDWPEELEENGQKIRTIYYTLSINYAIGPKCSPSTEKQILYPESSAGESYLVDAECINGGVPYSDHFLTVVRYCMTRPTPGSTRLSITGRVIYLKPVWGFIKGFIEKTAVSGLSESFGVMAEMLRSHSMQNMPSSSHQQPSAASRPHSLPSGQRVNRLSSSSTSGRHRRSRRQLHSDGSAPSRSSKDVSAPSSPDSMISSDTGYTGSTCPSPTSTIYDPYWQQHDRDLSKSRVDYQFEPFELMIVVLFIVIIALVLVNAALYYQVTALETTVARTILREKILLQQ